MSSFKASYINELYKISKKKKIIVALVLYAAAVVIAGLIVTMMNEIVGIRVANADFPITVLNVLSYTLVPLFAAFVAIDMVGGEFHDNTIKLTLTRPVSRFKIYLSKAAATATFIFANLMYIMILALIGAIITGSRNLSVLRVFLAYVAAFMPIFVFSLLIMLVSNVFKSTGGAFFISIILFIALAVLGIVFSPYRSFFIVPLFDWYNLLLGSYINVQKILRIILILLAGGGMLFTMGYYLFERKDV